MASSRFCLFMEPPETEIHCKTCSPPARPFARTSWRASSREQKLVQAICGGLCGCDDLVGIDADQLPSPFDRPSVDEHPIDVLRLCVQHDLADGIKTWREVHSPGIQDDQVGFLSDCQRT